MQQHPSLLRRLTTTDAVVIGLGSMIGAGVFAAFAPAARAAVHPTYRVPHHAEITLAIVVSAIVLAADLRTAGYKACFASDPGRTGLECPVHRRDVVPQVPRASISGKTTWRR